MSTPAGTPRRKAGRPPESGEARREAQRKAILEALRAGNTRRAAGGCSEVSETTFQRWLQEDGAFRAAVENAESEAEAYYLSRVQRAADDSWQAGAWWLERRKPKDYGRSDTVRILNQAAKECASMSDEQLAALAYAGEESE